MGSLWCSSTWEVRLGNNQPSIGSLGFSLGFSHLSPHLNLKMLSSFYQKKSWDSIICPKSQSQKKVTLGYIRVFLILKLVPVQCCLPYGLHRLLAVRPGPRPEHPGQPEPPSPGQHCPLCLLMLPWCQSCYQRGQCRQRLIIVILKRNNI